MNMLKRVLPLALSFASPALVADTEFEGSVPLEVVTQFMGRAPVGSETKLYSDIFEAFPPFTVPTGFDVLGSADQGFSRRVILVTELDGAEAGAAVSAAFTAEGWTEMPQYGAPQVGFVNTSAPQFATQLCHDEHGLLFVIVSPGDGKRYVSINQNVTQLAGRVDPTPSCAQLTGQVSNEPGLGFRSGGMMLNQYVPAMVMPVSAQPNANPLAGRLVSSGGGGNEFESIGALTIDWSIGEVFEHFVEQITEQDWVPDANATGEDVALGSWTKTVDDMELLGTLTVLDVGENNWELRFRLVRRNAGDAR